MTISLASAARSARSPQRVFADLPSIERHRAVWMIAAASGLVAALLNTSAPVGIGAADALYRAALAVATVWFASRARRWTWPVLSGVAAVATAPLFGQVVAVIALGAAAGALGAQRRNRVIGAVIAAASVPALLAQGEGPLWRLTDGAIEDPFGTSAVITVLAVAPVFASGRTRMPRRHRRHLRRVVRVAAAAMVATIGLSVGAVALALPSMAEGARATREAGELGGEGDLDEAATRFDAAARNWSDANVFVSGPWMLPGRLLPVLGQHIRAAQVVTGQASALTQSSLAVAERLDTDSLVLDGRVDVAQLDALTPTLDALAATTQVAEARLTRAQSRWLIPPLEQRLADGVDRLGPIAGIVQASAEALHVGADLLGGDDPATIVVMFTTPAEARGVGGFAGSWAEFSAEGGTINLVEHHRSKALNDLLAANGASLGDDAEYAARYSRFQVERHIQDVTLSPDFPSVAAVAADLYAEATGTAPDAIVMIDPFALEALLTFTGPIVIDPSLTLTAGNTADVLLRTQYERFADDEDGRERLLDEVAESMVLRLIEDAPDPIAFAREFAPLAEQGRVALWLADDIDGSIVDELGLAAGFPRVDGDLLSVVHQNGGQNKIDAHLRREIDVVTTMHPSPELVAHDVRITLHNDAPSSGMPDSVIGSNDQGLPLGTNRMTLSLYSPLRVEQVTIDGNPAAVESQTEFGVGVYSVPVVIPPGSSVVVELRLSGHIDLDRGYSMTFDSQPLARPDVLRWRVGRSDGAPVPPTPGLERHGGAVGLDTLLDKQRTIHIDTD